MLFDLFPGFFHFLTPMNIIKDDNGIVMRIWQELMKIANRWFITMVAIDVGKVNNRKR